MAIILRKHTNEIHPQRAVSFKKDLPKLDNEVSDVRYVKRENTFYIFNGIAWQEVDLVME
jgi:hypothetical protein